MFSYNIIDIMYVFNLLFTGGKWNLDKLDEIKENDGFEDKSRLRICKNRPE